MIDLVDVGMTGGVSLFIWIVCILAGLGAALTFIDVKNTFSHKKDASNIEDKEAHP